MAIDTQQKRMSAAGAGRSYIRGVFPVATPTLAWRLNVGHAYAGNALSPGTGAVVLSLANSGGLAGYGGLASKGGGLAG